QAVREIDRDKAKERSPQPALSAQERSNVKKSLQEAVEDIDREEEEERKPQDSPGFDDGDRGRAGEASSGDEEDEEDPLPPLPDSANRTFLRFAFHGNLQKAKAFLQEQEADQGVEAFSVNTPDRHGWTALMWATARDHQKFANWLCSRGALVNMREHTNGWTALHLAAINSRLDLAQFLIQHGARVKLADNWGDIAHECVPRPLKGPKGDLHRELRRPRRAAARAQVGWRVVGLARSAGGEAAQVEDQSVRVVGRVKSYNEMEDMAVLVDPLQADQELTVETTLLTPCELKSGSLYAVIGELQTFGGIVRG
ncbi:Ankyrin repeat and SAM domain-containing protein 3, partial [Durusdinium trenchii]